MYRRVLAFDFDGTLAVEGRVAPALETALEQCRNNGHVLFLATGRRYETVTLGRLGKLFTGIVWENGAVLSHTASGEIYLPFGQLNPGLLKAMEEAGVPFERGLAIAATWTPHDRVLWRAIRAHGGSSTIEYNKGAVMVLPPGASKGTGLERLLALCGFSPRNLAAFGDAENDLSMLMLAEVAIVVGDAVPAAREIADVVADAPGPQGVLEILERYPIRREFLDIPLKRERPILLGHGDVGNPVTLSASRLAGRNLGVFGDSGTGKSWIVGLIAEGLHHEAYQVFLIDPEGDFRALRVLPRFISLTGNRDTLPSPASVISLLDAGGVSVVLDLSQYPVTLRMGYVAELLRALCPVLNRKYRPHWIVLDEAQQFLFDGSAIAAIIAPGLEAGGWAFVSYRPDRLSPDILHALHHCLLTRLTDPQAVAVVREQSRQQGLQVADLENISPGSALLCSGEIVQLRPSIRRVPHIRHLYKYLEEPLPPHKRFWFRDEHGGIGKEASSLYEFLNLIPTLPIESLEYHARREDFSHWAVSTLGDADLAAGFRKVTNRQLVGEELRQSLYGMVSTHYMELSAMRQIPSN
jgi:hypothetical protein